MHTCHTSVQPVSSFQAQTALRRPLSSLPGERWRRTSAPSVTAPTRRGRGALSARPCAPDTSAGRCRAAARASASAGALPRPGLLGDSGRHRPSAVCWSPVLGPSGRFWEAPAKYIRLSMRNRENCWSLCFLSQRLQEKELDEFQNIHKNFGQKKKKKKILSLNKCAIFTVSTLKSTIIYEMYFYNPSIRELLYMFSIDTD